MMASDNTSTRYAVNAAWAAVGALVVYLAWGWVASPAGCDAACEVVRRGFAVMAGAFTPIFAAIVADAR